VAMVIVVIIVGAIVGVVIVIIRGASTGRTTTVLSVSGSFFGVRFGFGNRVVCRIAFVSAVEGGFGIIFRFVTSIGLSSSSPPLMSSHVRARELRAFRS
jgi:hypothetical protein